nr:integrase, catalytic region, zinc finger, CCHC-type, peptidase aspartic, catalytic [Tanacetum cinerariifolium]
MELAVEQHCEEKTKVQIKMENVLQEYDRLLTQALSVEIVNIIVHENMKSVCLNVTACARCVTIESELKTDFLKNKCYDALLQKDIWSSQEGAPTFAELFEINNLKARAQAKDTVILKLKEKLNSLNGDVKDRNVKRDVEEIKTLNIKLDHKENVLVITALKEQLDKLRGKVVITEAVSLNSIDPKLLKENVLVITALKEQLDKLRGKAVITEAVSLNSIDPKLLKVDVTPVVSKLRKNKTAHIDYIRHTQGEAATLRKIVESERLLSPLNTSLDYANACPLTRITTPTEVPCRKPIALESNTPKPVVTLVYSQKPKASINNVSVSKFKINKSLSANKKEPNQSLGSIVSNVPSSSIDECSNDHVAKIMGHGDYQIRNVTISRVYLVEGLGHNLFSVGQFCDSKLEVVFRQHTCFIRNLEGVDMLSGS